MSYDKSIDRNRTTARRLDQVEDRARESFLRLLARAEFEVTDFEAKFLNSFLAGPWFWTESRRATCDKMRKTYGGRL